MNDHKLDELLKNAREEVELPTSFQRQVWQEIAADSNRRMAPWAWWTSLIEWLARPLPAAAAWSLALFGGLLIGYMKPQPTTPADRAAAYAQTINPLAKM
jgi:hypothetical protein